MNIIRHKKSWGLLTSSVRGCVRNAKSGGGERGGGGGGGGGYPERDGGEGEEERLFGGDSINRMCDFIHDQDFDQIGSLECL